MFLTPKKKKMFIERLFGEPKMVLLLHHCKTNLLEFLFLRV